MRPKKTCPVCSGKRLKPMVTRAAVPVHQNRVFHDAVAARHSARGDLTMALCLDCGFVFNRTFDAGLLEYENEYDNAQEFSPLFSAFLQAQVRRVISACGTRRGRVVEIGCGKGAFIKALVAEPEGFHDGLGLDTSYRGPDTALEGRVRFSRRFFGGGEVLDADAVVCRHVIEHIDEPVKLLQSIREGLRDSRHARVFFETPSIEWILENEVVWDFFYEHCSLFSEASLATAFQASGFRVDRVSRVFAGQYLWIEASLAEKGARTTFSAPSLAPLAGRFRQKERELVAEWRERIGRLSREGPVALWGAGAKGITLANLADPEATVLDCLIDINPRKNGGYVAGTGHPIISPGLIPSRHIRHAILLNPNYRDEVLQFLAAEGIAVDLH
jgi:SAM-dependent methyltransferase